MLPQKSVVHFEGLNLLRFVAAMMILVYHSWISNQDSGFAFFVHNLAVGVDFFFIISGFLITYLLLREKAGDGTIRIGAFYLRRILRIFPLYYFIVLCSFVIFSWRQGVHINYVSQLYFWGNFETIKQQDWIGGFLTPLWTICVEEHFYLVIPFLIFLFPVRSMKWFYAAIILISIGIKIYFATHFQSYWFHINCHTLSRMDVIGLGGLLGCIYFEHPFRLKLSPLFVCLFVVIIIFLMGTINFNDYSGIAGAAIKRYLINIPLLFFFCIFIFNDHPVLTAWKKNRVLDYLGSVSYGIYMYHSIVLFCIKPWIPDQTIFQKVLLSILASIFTIGIAAISYRYLETPFLRIKNRLERVKTQEGEH